MMKSRMKKMADSRIMTFNTTNIAPKNLNVSMYKRSLPQKSGEETAMKL